MARQMLVEVARKIAALVPGFVAGDVRSAQSSTSAAEMDKVRVCGGCVYLYTGEAGRY